MTYAVDRELAGRALLCTATLLEQSSRNRETTFAVSTLSANSRRVTDHAIPASAAMNARRSLGQSKATGTYAAPTRMIAIFAAMRSGSLGRLSATLSPGAIPLLSNHRERARTRLANRRYLQRSFPCLLYP